MDGTNGLMVILGQRKTNSKHRWNTMKYSGGKYSILFLYKLVPNINSLLRIFFLGTNSVVQWLRLHTLSAWGLGLTPAQEN